MPKNSQNNRTALITGAATGIGRATVLRLARDGFRVVVNYKDSQTQKEVFSLAKILRQKDVEYLVIKADISKQERVKKMMDKIIKEFKSLDVVINNAGINQTQPFERLNLKDFDKVLETNLRGAILVTKYALPYLKKSPHPRIIFISSLNSFTGSPKRPAYVVSKSGILGITKALALELAPKILVNAVAPGYINTEMLKKFSSEPLNKKVKKIPLKRFGEPEEVANVISFLCSEDASYITGQCIHVNGGLFFA